jgi:uncharacterized protein involved in cysteine biosynthesis
LRILLTPLFRAFEQFDDPAFRRVLLHSLLWTALAFVGLMVGGSWLLLHLAALTGWWHAGIVGGFLGVIIVALLTYLLFVPLATGIAGLYADQIADAVERRWYPGLPAPSGASLVAQSWDGVALGIRVLLAHLVGLIFLVVLPGLGIFVGWAIGAWAVGRGLFVMVAMRRARRPDAITIYSGRRLSVVLQGALLTAMGLVPLLNLLVPVVGVAVMIHLLHAPAEAARRAGA